MLGVTLLEYTARTPRYVLSRRKGPDICEERSPAENGVGIHRPRLLDEVRNRLRLKHYSLRTEKAYVYWIRRYIHANGRRHPRELDGVAVECFLSRLATEDHVAPSTQNQALSALLFLYGDVLGRNGVRFSFEANN